MLINLRQQISQGLCWQNKKGQIATIVVLLIAVILLFLVITLNISQVAMRKTSTAIAADGAAITLASYVGSYAHLLNEKNGLGDDNKKCKFRYGKFFKVLALILAVVLAIFLPGGWGIAAWIAFAVSCLGMVVETAVIEPRQVRAINRQLMKIPLELNLQERAIIYAFRNTVDDPVMVVDEHDYDEDGKTDDKISRFWKDYQTRVISMAEGLDELKIVLPDLIDKLGGFKDETNGHNTYLVDDFITLLKDLQVAGFLPSTWQPGPTEAEIEAWEESLDSDCSESECESIKLPPRWDEVYEQLKIGEVFADWVSDIGLITPEELMSLLDAWRPPSIEGEKDWIDQMIDWEQEWTDQKGYIANWVSELDKIGSELGTQAEELDTQAEEKKSEQEESEDLGEGEDSDEVEALLAEAEKYRNLAPGVGEAITHLGGFQGEIDIFSNEVGWFIDNNLDFEFLEDMDNTYCADYTWEDSLGEHTVIVEIEPFGMPWLEHEKGFLKGCIYLRNSSGYITVRVTRIDKGGMNIDLPGGMNLWADPVREDQGGSGSRTITSEATAHYYWNEAAQLSEIDGEDIE